MIKTQPIKYGHSEVAPRSDLKEKNFEGFANKTGKRDDGDIKTWAEDIASHANHSIYAHVAEFILKIPSYFISHSDLNDTWWAKSIFAIERITGTFGDMFRNSIYSHRDRNSNLDDDIGAEIHAGDNPNHSLGIINNHAQTKGKFLVGVLGFINPTLANDLEWSIVRALDGWWWRRMGVNLAFGEDFGKKLFNGKITWKFVVNKFKEHCKGAKDSWKKSSFLDFCQHSDKIASSFLPVVNCLNIFGDLARPIARRLDLSGIPRNTIRILSAIDRPFFWLTNMFRFYLPEKYIQNSQLKESNGKVFNHLSYSDLLLGSTIGEIADFTLLAFEDKVKESSGMIQHLVEIIRKAIQSTSDIYFSVRRKRALEELRG